MLIQLVEDLRFVIGVLFGILSTILILVGFIHPEFRTVGGSNLNLISGSIMGLFSIVMLSLSLSSLGKSARK